MADLPASVDAGVLEELLQALLEVAARKDALRSWRRDAPPDAQPPVQARRDEDGTLGVFRFFTIVAPGSGPDGRPDVRPDPLRDMTADDARARIDGVGELQPGDEVGVELPLGRLAAIALADVEGTRDGRAHLLPARIVEMLGNSALALAVAARLSSLRGPPPHVPLRRLVTDHGDDVVEWTAVCADVVDPAERRAQEHNDNDDDEGEGQGEGGGGGEAEGSAEAIAPSERAPRGELIVLVARGGDHRLVVVPTATSAAGHAALLRALAPPPAERSLWRFLEVEGPKLLCGDHADVALSATTGSAPDGDALWSDEGPPGENARRLSLEVKSIAISRDPTVYGVVRARARLLTWSGTHIIDDAEAIVGLPVDLARVVGEPWPEGEALDRVVTAARAFRASLQKRLSALVDARQPTVHEVLAGAGFLRVLARAAADAKLGSEAEAEAADAASHDDDDAPPLSPAEPPDLRDVVDPPSSWPEDEIALRVGDVGVLVLSPADDVVRLRTFTGGIEDVTDLFVDGALVDGDEDAWRAFTDVFAQAIADAEVDVELAFPVEAPEGEESDDVETVMLSAWLLSLGEPTDARPNRWPPHPRAAESAQALQLLVDRFVDAGPLLPRDASSRDSGRRR